MISSAGFDLSQTDRLLTTTRSVRRRLDLTRPVERELILECLRIAVQAPSGGNSQPWRWLVVDDPDVRADLARLYRKSHDPYIESQRRAARRGSAQATERVLASSQHLADHLEHVPVLVIPCLLTRLPENATAADAAGLYGSILPAAWSFMLALRSRGLGAAWTTLHLAYEHEAAEVLGIPHTVTQAAMIPVAHTTGGGFRTAQRRPVEEVTYWNGWRRRAAASGD
jgi:nitroreductase